MFDISAEQLPDKPDDIFMDTAAWQHCAAAVYSNDNLLLVGPQGCGKTVIAKRLAKLYHESEFNESQSATYRKFSGPKPPVVVNMGSTQRPRSTLIGNFVAEDGSTKFSRSGFSVEIQEPSTCVVLDELSRANKEAWNILLPVLDPEQRCLHIDETGYTVEVPESVSFVGTANQGHQFTSSNKLDASLKDRFVTVEIKPLGEEEETSLLKQRYPEVNPESLSAIAKLAVATRDNYYSPAPSVENFVSTRQDLLAAKRLNMGFDVDTVFEHVFVPLVGGEDAQSWFKTIAQDVLF